MNKRVTIPCITCAKPFNTVRPRQAKYCSNRCSAEARFGQINDGTIPCATTGAISELIVSVNLLQKGYEVYRALSPACSCDLAIFRKGTLLQIEVRTGYRNKLNGKIETKRRHTADILAIVVNGDVIYEPDLPIL